MKIIILCLLLATGLTVQQQTPNQAFEVGEDRLVSVGGPEHPLVEPYLAINPKDPNNMLAAANVVTKPDMSSSDCAAFATFDGGLTWTRHDFGFSTAGDVWVAFLPDGTAVLSVIALTERDETPLLVFRSSDGGRTWPSKPTSLGNYHDHPTLAVDRLSKQFAGSLYAVTGRSLINSTRKERSAIYVARSTDGGSTFLDPVHVIASNLSHAGWRVSGSVVRQQNGNVSTENGHREGDGENVDTPARVSTATR